MDSPAQARFETYDVTAFAELGTPG